MHWLNCACSIDWSIKTSLEFFKLSRKNFREWWAHTMAFEDTPVQKSNWPSAPIYHLQRRSLRLHGRMIKAPTFSSVSSTYGFSKNTFFFVVLSSFTSYFFRFSAFSCVPFCAWIKQEERQIITAYVSDLVIAYVLLPWQQLLVIPCDHRYICIFSCSSFIIRIYGMINWQQKHHGAHYKNKQTKKNKNLKGSCFMFFC